MTTPFTWITDRLPTEADGDDDGDVIVLSDSGKTWYSLYWEGVHLGESWLPFIPPTGSSPSAPTASQPRRIVSISRTVYGATHTIDAVADDGTAWWSVAGVGTWTQLSALPQQEAE